jgi:hypothetical protein
MVRQRRTSERFALLQRVLPLALVTLSGCTSPAEAPQVRAHHTRPAGPLVQTLHVDLEQPAPVRVEYWTEHAPRLMVDSAPAATHRVPLTRLRADRTYFYRIVGTASEGAFSTEALPPDLARVQLTASGSPTTPLVLAHLYDPQGFRGYAAVDGGGNIVWYWRTVDMALGATRRANGHAVFLDRGRGLVEVRSDGSAVHELPQDAVNRELHHDVIVTPQDTLLFLAFDSRLHRGAMLKGEAIWEWQPETGDVVKRWSSWEHLSPDEDRGPRSGEEWLHANSLALGPRGNVLMSIHFLNQVISISPDLRRVEWRLGGVNATRALAPSDQYSGQHTARELASDRLLVFDNGLQTRESSRALELDLRGATAKAVWQWQPARRNRSAFVSSARRLASGHTLVAFGMSGVDGSTGPVEVFEVTREGEPVWHLELGNTKQMFRAEPWSSIGSEYEADEHPTPK